MNQNTFSKIRMLNLVVRTLEKNRSNKLCNSDLQFFRSVEEWLNVDDSKWMTSYQSNCSNTDFPKIEQFLDLVNACPNREHHMFPSFPLLGSKFVFYRKIGSTVSGKLDAEIFMQQLKHKQTDNIDVIIAFLEDQQLEFKTFDLSQAVPQYVHGNQYLHVSEDNHLVVSCSTCSYKSVHKH